MKLDDERDRAKRTEARVSVTMQAKNDAMQAKDAEITKLKAIKKAALDVLKMQVQQLEADL